MKKILGLLIMLSFIFEGFVFAENFLNLGDFLTVYFEGTSAEISKDWQNVDVKYKNVTKDSPLYKSLQKGIYLDLFPNLAVELPIDQYISQDKAAKLLNIIHKKEINYTKGKKIDTDWIKGLISDNLKEIILSKNILSDIKDKIEQNYFYPEKINKQQFKNKDIAESIETMDDEYTVYFPKSDAEEFNDSINGSFEGIGAYIEIIAPGIIIIKAPLKDSPAEKYGLKAGDMILEAAGNKVLETTSVNQLIDWIKGPEGTFVKILIQRGETQKTFNIKRGKIVLPNIEYEVLEGNNCYVSINQFNSQSRIGFAQAINFFDTKECDKYIFDVRNNPGGILEDVGYMLNYFVTDGEVGIKIKYKEDEINMVANDATKKITNKDIIVLINGGSASASEIFAGVIKDYVPHSLLLGTTTFGKGSVQNLIEYKDGSILKYTVAKRYTGKSNQNIDGIGFEPDLELEDNLNTTRDEVLEVAKIYKFK